MPSPPPPSPAPDPALSPAPWPKHGSEPGPDLYLFQPRWDEMENPRTGERMRRLVLETRDWVNVVARTAGGHFVLVRQYRFGTARVTTEIPGGVIDPGEEPIDAARRELSEETGYEADTWHDLGSVEPNPAFHDNRCHHFLADGARLTGVQELDPGEDIVVETVTESELRERVLSGDIDHVLALSGLMRVMTLYPNR